MHKIGKTSSGNYLVEMTPSEWKELVSPHTWLLDNLGSTLKEYRKQHLLSQKTFGEKIGLSRNTIANFEKGYYDKVTLRTYRCILDILLEGKS